MEQMLSNKAYQGRSLKDPVLVGSALSVELPKQVIPVEEQLKSAQNKSDR